MTEQQPYDVIAERDGYEIRHYPEHLVADVAVDADFESAGSSAFRRLVTYINGGNADRQRIAMTAPVVQQEQQREQRQVVSFVLPSSMTVAEPPAPADPTVRVRRVPAERAAALRFSGRWTVASYRAHVERLRAALARDGIEPSGEPRFARYDPPWTPWFMRRNEVLLPVPQAPPSPGSSAG